MMKNQHLQLLMGCCLLSLTAVAQTPTISSIDLDVNKFRAHQMANGDMWYNPATATAACEFPKGSMKYANYGGSIWMSGYDMTTMQLHTAAALYGTGYDYWSGPLDASTGSMTVASANEWSRFWKINRKDVVDFLALTTRTTSTVSSVILTWPAKGNPYATGASGGALIITYEMAPFVDTDGDGLYDPLKGDYPDLKGDQMIWWVFSDNGPTHSLTKGLPLGIEYHAMAYGYNRGTAADNIIFYEFKMHNKSHNRYSNFRFGLFSDADLGNPFDDYIAFDSTHRMGIEYNMTMVDGPNGANSYGSHAPMTGLSFLEMPGDNYPSTVLPAGNFSYFENASTGSLRDPKVDTQFHNYLHGKNLDGNTYFEGRYAFPISKGAMQCDSGATGADRRYVISTDDYTFQPGTVATLAMAFMATDTTGYGCPVSSFKPITDLADTAWKIYHNPLPPLSQNDPLLYQHQLKVYPNPATTALSVELTGVANTAAARLQVYDITGKRIQVSFIQSANTYTADISALAPGVYALVYQEGSTRQTQTFVKR